MEQPRDILERTFEFALRVVRLCQVLEEKRGVAATLGKQLLRAGTSIGANMEEAQGGQSRADFVSKCAIARKEARETHYWLRLIAAAKTVPQERIDNLLDEYNQLIAILTSIIKKTKGAKS